MTAAARRSSIFAVWFLACAAPGPESAPPENTLRVHLSGDERAFFHCGNMAPRLLLFDPLIGRDEHGELEGRLAESWEVSEDGRSWRVRLDPRARWHDGRSVTAADIAFTLELVSAPEVGFLRPDTYTLQIADDRTYTITHHPGPSGLPVNMYSAPDEWNVYYPRHLLEGIAAEAFGGSCEAEFWSRPIGSGPYRWLRHEPGRFVELEANEDYYREPPRIERVIFRFGGNPVTELLAGNVDVAAALEPLEARRVTEDPRFRAYYALSGFAQGIIWNQRTFPAFADARVRRALTQAIDRRALSDLLGLPAELPIFDVPHSERQYLRGEVPDPLPHDPSEAARLLTDAGWRDEDGDGIRERSGRPFRFTAITSAENERVAVFVQAELRKVGVRMEIQPLDYSLSLQRRREGDFEAAIHFLRSAIVARGFFDEGSPFGTADADVAERLASAWGAFLPDRADTIYRELWPYFERELPVTFLVPGVLTHVAHRRVRGLRSPDRASPSRELPRLWLEDEP